MKIRRCWVKMLKEAKEFAESCAEAKMLNEGMHKLFDKLQKALEKEPLPEKRKGWRETRSSQWNV
jgi:hypothetical protein